MPSAYVDIPLDQSHRLINHGSVVLLSTKNLDGTYDIAPVAWNCPASKSPPKLLVVVGRMHRTWENMERTGQFIAVVPHRSQRTLVMQTGSISGQDVNKFERFGIDAFPGARVDALIPRGCVGFLECEVENKLSVLKADAILGQVLGSAVVPTAFDGRLLVETEAGQTLHHLGGAIFATPAAQILS
ncbi:MAG: flavin reductase family protein [Planctomycetota bacterium]|jgi:flavin reductase (DIM6/NTAB) family NADH-FMN oxidoreductase RutF